MSIEPYLPFLFGIGKGLFYGALSAGVGYVKKETIDSFDPYKFAKTMIVGAIVGGIIGGSGLSLSDLSATVGDEIGIAGPAIEAFTMMATISFADRLVKVIARRTDLMKLWNKIKDFLKNK